MNKYNELSGLGIEDLSKNLKQMTKDMEKYANTEIKIRGKSMDEWNKMIKDQQDTQAKSNVYMKYLEEKYQKSMAADSASSQALSGDTLANAIWRVEELRKIQSDSSLSSDEKSSASDGVNAVFNLKASETAAISWANASTKFGDTLSKTLSSLLFDTQNFDKNMKKVTRDLLNYMLEQTVGSIFNNSSQNSGGIFGNLGSSLLGFGAGLFGGNKFHSGGVVPSGSNYNLTGTQEQLALLKGGERVLSPGENVQYENTSGGSKVNFINFNIKAWDSKDVQKYLLENKELLNSITFNGIKDNDQMLRHMVKNA